MPATALLGRDADLDHLLAVLHDPTRRIVTLTGLGGVGKTRLAVAAAHRAGPSFPDGVVFVELAPLNDPVRVLLVLDNLEHLLPAVGAIARTVEACPGLTLLAASRAPLEAPTGGTREELDRSPAAALFLERARAVLPDLHVDEAGAVAVAEICRRLAGIPLAVELAAAHVRYLDPVTLATRLDAMDSAYGARDLPRRQRTMHATLDWSYRLLSPEQRSLLRLLSTFVGSSDLDAVEEVAESSGLVPRSSVLAALRTLVEHSLVVTGHQDGVTTYRLLEPVAQFARARLVEDGEDRAADTAHLRFHVDLAERAYPHFQREQQDAWLLRVHSAHADMTAAIERARVGEDPDDAARIGWALWLYRWLRGHVRHGRGAMTTVLDAPLSGAVRTRAEIALATMCFAGDDVPTSRVLWDSAWQRSEGGPDALSTANGVAGVGLADLAGGDPAAARARFTEALPLAERAGVDGEWLRGLLHVWLGTVLMLGGDPAAGEAEMTRGLDAARERGDRLTTYIALFNLSQVPPSVATRDAPAATWPRA